jgi:chemotaxis protein CheC
LTDRDPACRAPDTEPRPPRLSGVQLDFLREMMNIGASSAAAALSRMLGCPVAIDIPRLCPWPGPGPRFLRHHAALPVAYAAMPLTGDAPGTLLFLVRERDREALTATAAACGLARAAGVNSPAEGDRRFGELADIAAGVFLTAVRRFCGVASHHAPPALAVARGGAVLERALVQAAGPPTDPARVPAGPGGALGRTVGFVVEAPLTVSRGPARVHLLLAPRPEGAAALTGAMARARALCLG